MCAAQVELRLPLGVGGQAVTCKTLHQLHSAHRWSCGMPLHVGDREDL